MGLQGLEATRPVLLTDVCCVLAGVGAREL